MEVQDYKNDIVQSRVGSLGSSDAKILAQVASLGYVPKPCHKRLAICKGLISPQDTPTTEAMRMGDMIEMEIYNHISAQNPNYQSNPLWVSERYSKPNVKLISHPDIVLFNEEEKTIYVYECKATLYTVEATRQNYKQQLYVHYVIAHEIAAKKGRDWKVKLFLVHYDTNDMGDNTFDVNRLTVKRVTFPTPLFDVNNAMDIISVFISNLTEYYEGDEIESEYLPEAVKTEFMTVTNAFREIKALEAQVDEFKNKLYSFMLEHNIKSIKNEEWVISLVNDSVSTQFNHKAYMEDLAKEHPRVARKIQQQYTKIVQRKGYVTIKIKIEK